MTAALKPFPHWVTDGYFDPFLLGRAYTEFVYTADESWHHVAVRNEKGAMVEDKYSVAFSRVAPNLAIGEIHHILSSADFIARVEALTGIPNLHFDQIGGGMHRIAPGGCLGAHVDFNVDGEGRWRRVNVLLYLNETPFEGDLQLFTPAGKIATRIPTKPNRMAIFICGEQTWHGHPDPLPAGSPDRYSLAAYYFTYEKPEGAAAPHSTLFLRRDPP